MGLKAWLAKKTSDPAAFAQVFTKGLMDLVEYLAASVVLFCGTRQATGKKAKAYLFESSFDLETAGFRGDEKDIAKLIAPSLEDLDADQHLLEAAFRYTVGFLLLCTENAANRYFTPEHASEFSLALFRSMAERCAGRFGFTPDPQQVANSIDEMCPSLQWHKPLNIENFGEADGLGLLLNNINDCLGDSTECGFVVGAKTQFIGCAAAMFKAISEIDKSLKRCAHDLQW